MLSLNAKPAPVEAVLRIDMLIEGEECAAGEVVELSAREFRYFYHFDRVLPATKENVDAVRAEVAARKRAAKANAAAADELTSTKSQLALALAEIERLKKAE
jgi:hypothetical protein